MRYFLILLSFAFLAGCGGSSSSGGGDNPTPTPPTEKVSLLGSWNTTATNTVCPGLTASYVTDFQTNNGSTISQVQRYGGGGAALIDLDTCKLVSFAGDFINLSDLSLPLDVSPSDFSAFARFGTAAYYGLEPSEITVTVDVFTSDRLQYTATAKNTEYGSNVSETLTLTR